MPPPPETPCAACRGWRLAASRRRGAPPRGTGATVYRGYNSGRNCWSRLNTGLCHQTTPCGDDGTSDLENFGAYVRQPQSSRDRSSQRSGLNRSEADVIASRVDGSADLERSEVLNAPDRCITTPFRCRRCGQTRRRTRCTRRFSSTPRDTRRASSASFVSLLSRSGGLSRRSPLHGRPGPFCGDSIRIHLVDADGRLSWLRPGLLLSALPAARGTG